MESNNRTVRLTLPAEADYIDLVRLTLYGISSKMGFSYEDIEDMKVAVSEACNNVVVHAYEPGQGGNMEVHFEDIDNGLRILVQDQGLSFDHDRKVRSADSLHNKSLDEVSSGGLGLYLMQALMDHVEVKGEQGTVVILTKMVSKSEEMV
ncbi:anti-sigma B factor RsbW [Paenibacillus lutrae]|uniref:Anti-sigma B factor RsbW n=1 Tax=Paenibacillus lutrae TaxID=2078573 RepID=A0A7X3K1P4_9BACL|nr:anti-sigma B factor RsbW [Paenibacillus lutrae]MVP02335.1 anti-sigma B factor RsbW [Paenibacillus lutrae]